MSADEALRNGNLDEALATLQKQVRDDPSNVKHRVFLFQLLCVLGDWSRALTQLNVSGDLDAGTLAMVQMYREALQCENLRAEVFDGKRSPLVFGEPDQWIALAMEALRLGAQERVAESRKLLEDAFEAAPATSGTIQTRTTEGEGDLFEWIADADSRLGPTLEAIVNGRYYWIPFQNIHQIHIEEPADLRDIVWLPVHFTWANGGEAVGLVPTRYPGSESAEDSQVRLARKTEWIETSEGVYQGLGQRTLATDAGDYPLMDVRLIRLDTQVEAGAEAQGTSADA